MAVVARDLVEASEALSKWLSAQMPAADDVRIANMEVPSIGFSGEILIFDASWREDGVQHEQGIAVRIEPTGYQVFLDTHFEEQYRVQESLLRTDVPTAPMIAFEADESILGARFYAMGKLPGRPYDVQVNPESWVLSLANTEQARIVDNFVDVLAGVHRLDPVELGLGFLDDPIRGATPFDQQIAYYREFYEWAARGEAHPVIDAAFRALEDDRPAVMPPTGLVWGDARLGNLLWGDDQRCTAALDWEMSTLGPAEEDFAWFLFQDHATPKTADSDARMSWVGSVVPPGVPSVEEVTERYERALGRPLQHLDYFSMWAELRTAIIIVRLTPQLLELGVPPLPNTGTIALAERFGMKV